MGRRGGRVSPTADDTLTPLMESFCVAYVAKGHTRAAGAAVREAGSLVTTDNAAYAQASEWLSMPKVQARIKELRERSLATNPGLVTRDELLAGLAQLYRANLTDYQTAGADGVWVDIDKNSPNTLALQSITSKTTEEGSVITKITIADKIRTAERIAKLMGWDAPDKQINLNVELTGDQIRALVQQSRRALESGASGKPETAPDAIEGEKI